ncbi:MAG: PaaI family thioesterase [Novosphingobium sp.]|nr:PaaI family thioesterase [Novosphingobium sp.]
MEPAPDNPGWHLWELKDPTRYNAVVIGPLLVRAESEDTARVRMEVQKHHTNGGNGIHGGTTLGLADVSMFAALHILRGTDASRAVTIDTSAQFIGAGDASRPLDSLVDVLRETRRLAFVRGLIVQEDDLVASFTGTVRRYTGES